ncbi:MAG: prepilin-type N-terminal cleavage/methylation domain-containing protein [Candidatus Omnitrophica bacterium]|nr:prepilin-type N-terminal cleavage/methylation domain-containing protein [Candidatus Omnitrophota bacterium]
MSRTSKGLTLIELLISVMLISVILGAIWVVYSTGVIVFSGQTSRYDIKDETSLAFITMTKELHQALSITAATATSVTFTADLDNNGVNETIQYTWSGTAGAPLNRVVGAATRTLVRSVQSIAFTYYNDNNVLLSVPVTLANVHLVAVDTTAIKVDETFRLRTKIFLQII